jgi:hypothetical protein
MCPCIFIVMANRNWIPIINEAERIALSYSTPVTLRQLHYRLVAAGVGGYENTQTCYKQLSALTAEERREGRFPQLSDRTRGVERPLSFRNPASAVASIISWYKRDRTEGQEYQTWVLYEKATLGAQIESWTEEYSIPTAALRGYSSESLEREIFEAMNDDGRPVVVWYVGDLDPEGEDIERNFQDQAERQDIEFEAWERLTVLPAQIGPLGLVPNPGKATSSRAAGFVRKYGRLFQIETEAVDPAILETLVTDAITHSYYFDEEVREESLTQEKRDIQKLKDLRDSA